jgi:predicted kinase
MTTPAELIQRLSACAKSVVIMRGVPGSGKSTLACMLEDGTHQLHLKSDTGEPDFMWSTRIVSADHFFLDAQGQYRFDPRGLGMAHAACLTAFLDAIERGTNLIIVDNTNTQRWEYRNYIKAATMLGYAVHTVHVVCQTEAEAALCGSRNAHAVPVPAVIGMWKKFERDAADVLFGVVTAVEEDDDEALDETGEATTDAESTEQAPAATTGPDAEGWETVPVKGKKGARKQ